MSPQDCHRPTTSRGKCRVQRGQPDAGFRSNSPTPQAERGDTPPPVYSRAAKARIWCRDPSALEFRYASRRETPPLALQPPFPSARCLTEVPPTLERLLQTLQGPTPGRPAGPETPQSATGSCSTRNPPILRRGQPRRLSRSSVCRACVRRSRARSHRGDLRSQLSSRPSAQEVTIRRT